MSREISHSHEPQKSPAITGNFSDFAVPEILAPAGGRAQFFAALNAGADAVYLGMKEFNARGRAENFTLEDLRSLVPLARSRGMKVLVTINILLKEAELPRLIADLAELQWIGVEAVIVQDIGVARLVRREFPNLRLHASTQMAVHNLSGVIAAARLGFRRVVMARELTAQELRKIRREIPRDLVEIEAFCHGSLCYSYSGLCFFSGAEDARSGNRGECAYTCRKPYKILNEPGHGFLFSMKDLNTSQDLDKLVTAGIDTLKIEGRKKDAQYVATSVGLYRDKLNQLFGRDTSPRPLQHETRDWERDMAFSFHREMTTFFVKGRYHENVIDLANPTHKGLLIGTVGRIEGRTLEFVTKEALERFDGLRIDPALDVYHAKPQHGEDIKAKLKTAKRKWAGEECQFSLRDFTVYQQRRTEAAAGEKVRIQVPEDVKLPRPGDLIYKIRSNELKRHTEALSQAPDDSRLRPLRLLDFTLGATVHEDELLLTAEAYLGTTKLLETSIQAPAQKPRTEARLKNDLAELFGIFGEAEVHAASITFQGDWDWFVPKSLLKHLKKQVAELLVPSIPDYTQRSKERATMSLSMQRKRLEPVTEARYQIKIDRLDYLPTLQAYAAAHPDFVIDEIVFEPKRAFLGKISADSAHAQLRSVADAMSASLRLALPTVVRAWDEPLLRPWLRVFQSADQTPAFEVGNLGALELVEEAGYRREDCDLGSDFTFYALNTEAALTLAENNVKRVCLSVEDDLPSIRSKLRNWPGSTEPQVILYKDTPLFIAEACSLTALHHGCPTASVCGYRTLEIENDEGERFFVAHESCKSIVYGKEAFAVSDHRRRLMELGVRDFRVDFLTREYTPEAMTDILDGIREAYKLPETHGANFERELL
jgi:putative protease